MKNFHRPTGFVLTCIVDEGVNVARACFDLLESVLNRFVTREIDFKGFNGVDGFWTILAEGLYSKLGLLEGTATQKDVVGFMGLQQGLDSLIANSTVGASDKSDLFGSHWCLELLGFEVLVLLLSMSYFDECLPCSTSLYPPSFPRRNDVCLFNNADLGSPTALPLLNAIISMLSFSERSRLVTSCAQPCLLDPSSSIVYGLVKLLRYDP